ncbi:MAG: hypothetical protein U9Q97_01535, partial [Acidobacteriota bacterium]|nr:hypothetical protein [Acidobacteriota bacterium]
MINFDVNVFVNSQLGPRLGRLLGPVLSQDKAYRLTDWGARQVARRSKSKAMRILRENQAVVRGLP